MKTREELAKIYAARFIELPLRLFDTLSGDPEPLERYVQQEIANAVMYGLTAGEERGFEACREKVIKLLESCVTMNSSVEGAIRLAISKINQLTPGE